MDLATFHRLRAARLAQAPQWPERCLDCLRPKTTCYCSFLRPFDPHIKFVILIHPLEFKRRLASGRMSHLCLHDSHLIQGVDFSVNEEVENLLNDSHLEGLVLYPGQDSLDLSALKSEQRFTLYPSDKKLLIFVIDGTWNTAGRMLRSHPKLEALPRVCFNPSHPSNFRVRKQPKQNFLSTLEAIHECIELIGPSQGFNLADRAHDNLLDSFTAMVDLHIDLNQKAREQGRISRYARRTRGRKLGHLHEQARAL